MTLDILYTTLNKIYFCEKENPLEAVRKKAQANLSTVGLSGISIVILELNLVT